MENYRSAEIQKILNNMNATTAPKPQPPTNIQQLTLSDDLSKAWEKISGAVTNASSNVSAKIAGTTDTVAKATETANKALEMVNGMMTIIKPIAIAAGCLLTTLVCTEIFLNFREIRKGK